MITAPRKLELARSCSFFDRSCIEAEVLRVFHQFSQHSHNETSDFEALCNNVAAGRHPARSYIDRDDVTYAVGYAHIPDVTRGYVVDAIMDHYDVAPKDGHITSDEYRSGLTRPLPSAGVRLRGARPRVYSI